MKVFLLNTHFGYELKDNDGSTKALFSEIFQELCSQILEDASKFQRLMASKFDELQFQVDSISNCKTEVVETTQGLQVNTILQIACNKHQNWGAELNFVFQQGQMKISKIESWI